ncbi:MAG: VCBS repeat-containing protein [Fimbriiglobus sp.]|nr:VCBS repeat-containing protein [Fimbriiglobus sp.]
MPRSPKSSRSNRPFLEILEPREVPALITVTSFADNVAEDGVVTLREAIDSMNKGEPVNKDVVAGGFGFNDRIVFGGAAATGGTISITQEFPINRDLEITGPTNGVTIVNAATSVGNNTRIFNVLPPSPPPPGPPAFRTLSLTRMNLIGGNVTGNGGAINITRGELNLTDVSVQNNTASGSGGGIFVGNGGVTFPRPSVTITRTATGNVSISGNTAQAGSGGGIDVANGFVTIEGASETQRANIFGNTAIGGGGGGINALTGVDIKNAVVQANTAKATGTVGGFGGGISSGGGISVINSRVDNNVATGFAAGGKYTGGGINVLDLGTLELDRSTVSGNASTMRGGGVYFYNNGDLVMTASTVAGNTTGDAFANEGGGLYLFGTTATIDRSTIANNQAGVGGGIFSRGGNDLTITNSTIVGNSASAPNQPNSSGGVTIDTVGTRFTLFNSIVALNNNGTGLNNADLNIAFNELNPAIARGLTMPNGTIGGFNLVGTMPVQASFNSLENLSGNVVNGALNPGIQVNFLGQPILSNNGGLTPTVALLPGSPAINNGFWFQPTGEFDQRNQASWGMKDIGAFEFVPPANTVPTISSPNTATFIEGQPGLHRIKVNANPIATMSIVGTLPPWVTLSNFSGFAELTGTPPPGSPSTITFTIRATNAAGFVDQPFTLNVHRAPVFTSANTATFLFNNPANSFTISTTAVPNAAISVNPATPLPGGVTLTDNGDGTATLTGPLPQIGTFTFNLVATNAVAATTQPFTLVVNRVPSFTSAPSVTFTAGQSSVFFVTTAAAPTATISTTSAFPPGMMLVNNGDGTATLGGFPSVPGTYTLNLTATNGVGVPATQTLTVTVNQAPVFTSPTSVVFQATVAGAFTVTTVALPPAAISTLSTLPPGMLLVSNGDGTATLSGTPTTPGTYTLDLTATNNVTTPSFQQLVVTVLPAPIVPPPVPPPGTVPPPVVPPVPPPVVTPKNAFLAATPGSSRLGSEVRVIDPITQQVIRTFVPYVGFNGPLSTAIADINADGVPDFFVGAGAGGGPRVSVFDGVTGLETTTFFAYSPFFTGGVSIAAGDMNGDGTPDMVVGMGAGSGPGTGPRVKVFDGRTFDTLQDFFAYDPGFTGGVNVAVGDVNGDGQNDIVTGARAGGGPHVRAFHGRTLGELASFFAYDSGFTGGVNVAAADLNGDGRAEIITGAGAGGGPRVSAWDATTTSELVTFFAYDPGFTGGVSVAAADLNGDNRAEIITGAGPGGGPHVKSFMGLSLAPMNSLFATDPTFTGGVSVG